MGYPVEKRVMQRANDNCPGHNRSPRQAGSLADSRSRARHARLIQGGFPTLLVALSLSIHYPTINVEERRGEERIQLSERLCGSATWESS